MIELNKISKIISGKNILKDLDLNIKEGDSVAITGRSGSGKTTLLNIIGGLTKFDSGKLIFKNKNLAEFNIDDLSDYRKNYIGFITQNFNLLDDRNVFENVALPLYYYDVDRKEIKKRVKTALKKVNMEKFVYSEINTLSGGEKQRVAIARAIIKNPKIILADEPTGALDEETENEILYIFDNLKKYGTTLIIVTHDYNVANHCNRIYTLKDGKLNLS